MSGLRTLVLLLIAGLAGARPAPAAESDARLFASCAGRLSALMEHQWLMADPAAERTAAERAAMLSLVAAILPPGPVAEAEALNWRVEAKAAQADLLARARFRHDDATAAQAARRSDDLLGACRALLLG